MRHALSILLILAHTSALGTCAMTHQGGMRLGDKLISYVKGKVFSRKYGIPFLCYPFHNSNQFALHQLETMYSPEKEGEYTISKRITNETDIQNNMHHESVFFSSDFFSCFGEDARVDEYTDLYRYCVENRSFRAEITKMLQPIENFAKADIPSNMISVAVHVRKGGGFDGPLYADQKSHTRANGNVHSDISFPLKFPVDQYYVDQIKLLSSLIGHKPMFVYIFTDDKHTKLLVNKYKKMVNLPNVTFACRERNNAYESTTLQDLWMMRHFDCLIRPASSFSVIAQLVGEHILIFALEKAYWNGGDMVIEKVRVFLRDHEANKAYTMHTDTVDELRSKIITFLEQ